MYQQTDTMNSHTDSFLSASCRPQQLSCFFKKWPWPPLRWHGSPNGRSLASTDRSQYADLTHPYQVQQGHCLHSRAPLVTSLSCFPSPPSKTLPVPRCWDGLWTRVPHLLDMPALKTSFLFIGNCLMSLIFMSVDSKSGYKTMEEKFLNIS